MLPDTGELSRRIVIRPWTDVPNGVFGLNQTFDKGITRYAKHEPVHGLAIRAGMQTGEIPTDLFWVRYGTSSKPEDVTLGHVVEWNKRRYRVLDTIDVDDAQQFTRITTKYLGSTN